MTSFESTTRPEPARPPLRGADYALLTLLAVLLFGYCAVSTKPLTMHEARLPQCSREMLASGEWLLPHSGERPWLERPPFPHWCELAAGHLFGRLDAVWIARIPPALMGLLTLLLVAKTGALLFGRKIGVLSSMALATMYEFYFYAGQAEDDIFLAFLVSICVTLFAFTEFPPDGRAPDSRAGFFGNRPWTVWAFFATLGLTGMAKGPLIGAIEIGAGAGVFMLLSRREKRLGRYVWLWGWILFAAVTLAWPVYAWSVYPSIWDNLKYDFSGPFGHEGPAYYLECILWTTAPWTPVWILGLAQTWRNVSSGEDRNRYRFLWCWALAPVVVLSIPLRKHHHYLVPALPAFGVLAAFGMQWIDGVIRRIPPARWAVARSVGLIGVPGLIVFTVLTAKHLIPGELPVAIAMGLFFILCVAGVSEGLQRQNGRMVLAAFMAGFIGFAAWGQSVPGRADDNKTGIIEFLGRVRATVPAGSPLLIDASGSMDFFRNQFYSDPVAKLLHNITYLRDERIKDARVYVMACYGRRHLLSQLGEWRMLDQSRRARRETSPDDRYTLFLLTFKPDLKRYPAPKVSVLQALERGVGDQAGPYCGPPPHP